MPLEVKITGHKTKEALKGATCVLPISVGQSYHLGAVFAETLRQIQETFAHVIIVIADTLQENSLILKGAPTAGARALALENGKAWLKSNETSISSLPAGFCTIMHWDDWLNNPGYREQKVLVDEKFISDPIFTQSVNDAAREYRKLHQVKAKAAQKRGLDPNLLCSEVILQEAAVIGLWVKAGYNYMAYPVGHSKTNGPIFDCLTKMYNENLELLNIEIEDKPVIENTTVAVAAQSEFSEEQMATIRELGDMITQPFLTQLFSVSRGSLLLRDDALKIALLLSIEEQVKVACTGLVQKMSSRQLAEKKFTHSQQKPFGREGKTSTTNPTQISSSANPAAMFPPVKLPEAAASHPSSPTRDVVLRQRRHSGSNDNNVKPLPLAELLSSITSQSENRVFGTGNSGFSPHTK